MTLSIHPGSRHSAAADAEPERPVNWRASGACSSEDPELFFPEGRSAPAVLQAARAKAVCLRCPVMDACYQAHLATGDEWGVWGGTTEDDRKLQRLQEEPEWKTQRRAEANQRRVAKYAASRALAVERGAELALARLGGATEQDLAEQFEVDLYAVRHALRMLLPSGPMSPSAPRLERAVRGYGEQIRGLARGERTDVEIGKLLRFTPQTVADARRVLAHLDAVAAQMGLAA